MKLPSSITLCEVGLRDGLQNEKYILSTEQKLELLRGLIDAKFPVIEVGSFMHPRAVPQMANTDEVFKAIGDVPGVELRALIPNLRGIQRAIDCGCKKVKLNVSASRQHNLKNLNMTPEESVAGFASCVDAAGENGIEISGSISMPFASPWEGRIPIEDVDAIIEAYLKVGITEISLSDASGMAVPNQVYDICCHVKEKYPQATWWLHFHNTRGMAMANILAAMEAGMDRFDSSFGGLGGCPFVPGAAGNISTEDVLHMCEEADIATGIDIVKVIELSKNLREILNHDMESYILRAGRSRDLIQSQQV
ncbi:hydroxymethylglutaryl-CoA lyase [[Clostridium] symbiosum]|uniref:hydroxymethylglutaryl-CoA lyase n=1 Tax=Clostridium symbiosum TaxID=1512 RepID=UPI001D06802A|nr:hydroxymethylglutaryl-CoA lyase [[Clostridium] symbiosum]MCB6610308.1 hydroxymethylglutaryl-CoA lyase [[Clostridium] symbiosum]MCB6932399.1 hydroxymethylglutaryl-CoA lyase [[Clostridium] symbiosum]